jgi:CRP/FNR family transcriptional regulator, cyclic AMP receptor protein
MYPRQKRGIGREHRLPLTRYASLGLNYEEMARPILNKKDQKEYWEGDERLKANLADWRLPPKVAAELVEHYTLVRHAKGSTIFTRGSPADVLYWIRAGLVALYYPLEDGRRILARLCGPGEIFGYADFISDTGHRAQSFEAVARTNCQIALLTHERVSKVLRELDSETLVLLLERVSTAWSMEQQRLVHFLGMPFRERLELVLADLAKRCGVKDDRGTLLLAELSHETLAEMIASSRPIVSKLLADMMEERIIIRDGGRYLVRKIQKLQT